MTMTLCYCCCIEYRFLPRPVATREEKASKSSVPPSPPPAERKGFSITKALLVILLAIAAYGVYYSEVYTWLDLGLEVPEIISPKNDNKMAQGSDESWKTASSVYDFKYTDIDGNEQSMEKFRGHVLIVANVATKCGFTKVNYEQLSELYEKYSETKGLRIIGFPCNQFAGQEPGTENEIKEFACSNYKVKFDLTSKVSVNGDGAHPLWKYMKSKQGGTLGSFTKWNFTKFLVDKKGQVVKRYGPSTNPRDMEKDLLHYFEAEE